MLSTGTPPGLPPALGTQLCSPQHGPVPDASQAALEMGRYLYFLVVCGDTPHVQRSDLSQVWRGTAAQPEGFDRAGSQKSQSSSFFFLCAFL